MFSRTMTGRRPRSAISTPCHRLGGPQVGVQPERLAQTDVDAAEPAADRGRDRALEPDLVAPDRLEDVRPGAACRTRRSPIRRPRPISHSKPTPGRVEDAGGRLRQLRPDAVAGDQGDSVGHGPIVATRRARRRPAARWRAGRRRVARRSGREPLPCRRTTRSPCRSRVPGRAVDRAARSTCRRRSRRGPPIPSGVKSS